MLDPDKKCEDCTAEQIQALLLELFKSPVQECGFCLNNDLGLLSWLDFLDKNLPDKAGLPVQVNSGSLTNPSIKVKPAPVLSKLVQSGKVRLLVHLPFPLLPYKADVEPGSWEETYVRSVAGLWKGIPAVFVVHCGYPSSYLQELSDATDPLPVLEKARSRLFSNLSRWADLLSAETSGTCLAVEGLSGAEKYPLHTTSVMGLLKSVLSGDPDKLGVLWDTEHDWACGAEPANLLAVLADPVARRFVKGIHLNSAPECCGFGRRIDLHSYTEIEKSLGRVFVRESAPQQSGVIPLDKFISLTAGIPKVTERHLLSISVKDCLFMAKVAEGLAVLSPFDIY